MENEELTLLNEKPERKKDEIASPDHMTKEISSSTDTSAEFWAAAGLQKQCSQEGLHGSAACRNYDRP